MEKNTTTNVEIIVNSFIDYLEEYQDDIFALINSDMEDEYEDEYQELQEIKGDWFCKYCDNQEEVNEALDLFDDKLGI